LGKYPLTNNKTEERDWTHSKNGGGKRGRERPRQKLMDWIMAYGYGKLKEKAQHREELSRWTFGPTGRQMT